MSNLIKAESATTALAVPDFLKDVTSKQGMEDLSQDTFKIPRIALLQSSSQDVKRGDTRAGAFQNSITKLEYGNTVDLVFLKSTNGAAYMTMADGLKCKSEDAVTNVMNGGKCKECWLKAYYNDWSPKPNGKTNPLCSKTLDFIAVIRSSLMSDRPEVVAVSFMKTSAKLGEALVSRAMALGKPLYAQGYSFGAIYTPHSQGDFYAWTVKYPGWLSKEEFERASQLYIDMKIKSYVVHDDIPSDKPAEERSAPEGF